MVSINGIRLTALQLGAMEAIDEHGSLRAGWGGFSLATMRSLDRRGLAVEEPHLRFRLSRAGSAVVAEHGRRVEANLP